MELSGNFTVNRPRAEVWAALNDAEVLRDAIPGCESLDVSEGGYDGKIVLKIGPIKASFSGRVNIADAVENERLALTGEGNGGIAGFAKGGATVTLTDTPEGTEVVYSADVSIGGKLAQLGNRLIGSTARQLAGKFFDRLNETLAQPQEPVR